jgi:small subunit ribosomal protein S4
VRAEAPRLSARGPRPDAHQGQHLREKQKLKRIYGVQERQFMLYFHEAERLKGNTGEHLMSLLERRLDNVVLAGGLALSRNHARQLVNHGHFTVNGRWVDVASYKVRPGDVVAPRTGEKVKAQISEALEINKSHPVPAWLEVNRDTLSVRVVGKPRREDIIHPIQEQLIIELCSK